MTWTVTVVVVPVLCGFIGGWFGREWFELRRIARMASGYDPYTEQFEKSLSPSRFR